MHFLLLGEQGARGELAGGDVILVKIKHVPNMNVEKNCKVTGAYFFLLAEMLEHYFSRSGGKAAERWIFAGNTALMNATKDSHWLSSPPALNISPLHLMVFLSNRADLSCHRVNWLFTKIYPTFTFQEAQFSFPDQVLMSHENQTFWDRKSRRPSGKTSNVLWDHSSLCLADFSRKKNSHFLEQRNQNSTTTKKLHGKETYWCMKFLASKGLYFR